MKFLAILLATGVAVSAQSSNATRAQAQAEQFQKKLQQIVAQANTDGSSPRRTPVSDSEVNAYLRVRGAELLPVGVTDPALSADGGGRVSGHAIVDLDVVREKKSSGALLDPTTYLTGRLPVTAAGILHTQNGTARFELQSATVSGIPIPKSFLQELVSYYTRSSDFPHGVSLDSVYELPANIREIQVGEGSAIVVQ
jgi:hypothetical protein